MLSMLSKSRHPERTLSSPKGQSKDPDALTFTKTARTFQPTNRVPHLRDGLIVVSVGSQDVRG